MTKQRTKFIASLSVICLIAVIGIVFTIKAYSNIGNAPKALTENGDIIFYEAQELPPIIQEPVEETFGGSDISSNYRCINGDCTFYLVGDFSDATTTIMAVADPFRAATTSVSDVIIAGIYPYAQTGATSTVELIRLNITGVATSTFTVACGASATNGTNGAGTQAYAILSSDSIATSSGATIENNISSSYGSQIGGGSVAKIMLNSTYPYLVCAVTTAYTGAFTEATNTFDGKYAIRISKTRF